MAASAGNGYNEGMIQKRSLLALALLAALPAMVFANGGDQRVVDGKYLINLSRAPFTPRVGVKTSLLASFVDIERNKLIAEDLIVKVRIAKLGGGGGKREFLFEKDDLVVTGGVLELAYTFAETGLHEIFFDFTFAREPQKIYEAPDFLLDVQKPAPAGDAKAFLFAFLGGIMGIAFCFLGGWFVKRRG